MNTLADTRKQTMADAENTMQQLAHVEARLEKSRAKYELRIAQIKSRHLEEINEDSIIQAELEKRLTGYVMANQDRFTKPRMHKTDFGEFGLRTVSNLEITDPNALEQALQENGYDDCYEIITSLKKSAVRKRIEAGEIIAGAEVSTGVRASYRVLKSLLDAARQEATGG